MHDLAILFGNVGTKGISVTVWLDGKTVMFANIFLGYSRREIVKRIRTELGKQLHCKNFHTVIHRW